MGSDGVHQQIWLWMRNAISGTYAVKIEGASINENFEDAVKEIISEAGRGSEQAFYEADLTTEPQPYDEQLLEDHPLVICKAYINGVEAPILYMGQVPGPTAPITVW